MKSTKRWLVILLLILMSLIFGGCGYEEDFPPTISGGNPPNYGNISKSAYFVIKNGKAITINEDDLSE